MKARKRMEYYTSLYVLEKRKNAYQTVRFNITFECLNTTETLKNLIIGTMISKDKFFYLTHT